MDLAGFVKWMKPVIRLDAAPRAPVLHTHPECIAGSSLQNVMVIEVEASAEQFDIARSALDETAHSLTRSTPPLGAPKNPFSSPKMSPQGSPKGEEEEKPPEIEDYMVSLTATELLEVRLNLALTHILTHIVTTAL